MAELWAAMLPAAIVLASSPTGLIEMMLVLYTVRARVNAIVFLASVMVSTFLLPLLGTSISAAAVEIAKGAMSPGAVASWVLVGLGALLVLCAFGSLFWRVDTTVAAVSDKIAGMGPGAVFALSLSVMVFNPINALVLLSIGSQAASADVSTTTWLLSLAAFTVLATAPFIAVVVLWVSGGERAGATVERFRHWLLNHSRITVVAVFGVIGLVLLVQGIASLEG
jgi:hypothetical protein